MAYSFVMATEFCVIYRWTLIAGKEDQFVEGWKTMTEEIRQHAGGPGFVQGCR